MYSVATMFAYGATRKCHHGHCATSLITRLNFEALASQQFFAIIVLKRNILEQCEQSLPLYTICQLWNDLHDQACMSSQHIFWCLDIHSSYFFICAGRVAAQDCIWMPH